MADNSGMSKAAKKNMKKRAAKRRQAASARVNTHAIEEDDGSVSPEEIKELLTTELAAAKESKDFDKMKTLREQIWIMNDLIAGVKTDLPEGKLKKILDHLPIKEVLDAKPIPDLDNKPKPVLENKPKPVLEKVPINHASTTEPIGTETVKKEFSNGITSVKSLEAGNTQEMNPEKKIRNLKKKMNQIEKIKEKVAKGENIEKSQQEKLKLEHALKEEIDDLELEMEHAKLEN